MSLVTLLTQPGSFKFYRGKGYTYSPRNVPWEAGTPGDAGISSVGTKNKPLITTPLPSVNTQPSPKTTIDSLFRGQGVVSSATIQDTQRISKFLRTEQGLQFLAKEQTLLTTQNIKLYGSNIRKWSFINPISYVTNTALAPTGEHVKNTLTFGLKPQNTREATYGELPTFDKKRTREIAKIARGNILTDKITTSPIYTATEPNSEYLTDTVPLYFVQINNDGTGNNTYIHFRSYISGLTDAYGAEWDPVQYMGRGEKFYSYKGFSRDLSFSLQIPVLSKDEQSSVYSKINYLASLMAPDYTQTGFMRGNLFKLTIGDYITDLPGIINGVTFDMPDDAGWDIANGPRLETDPNGITKIGRDGWVMPKLIEIKSIKFTPIHNFLPQTVNKAYVTTNGSGNNVNSPFITFGRNATTNNNAGGYKNPIPNSTTVASNTSTSSPSTNTDEINNNPEANEQVN